MAVRAECEQLIEITQSSDLNSLTSDTAIIGEGSNTLFVSAKINQLAKINIKGRDYLGIHEDCHRIRLGAGENWHQSVIWCLEHGYNGLENLAFIPGSAGAAPVQNIGAYGREIAQFIHKVTVYDRSHKISFSLSSSECDFSYRHSIFKTSKAKSWVITSIELSLPTQWEPQLNYTGLDHLNKSEIKAMNIFQQVIKLRKSKLPDPAETPNLGSFFKNPVISDKSLTKLTDQYSNLPHWDYAGKHKLSAAWLIDQCGWKGHQEKHAAVYPLHALILINKGLATGRDILDLATKIQQSVLQKFDIQLEIEPRLL